MAYPLRNIHPILLLLAAAVFCTVTLPVSGAPSSLPSQVIPQANGATLYEYDTNGDGRIDLKVWLDANGNKVKEVFDYNHDGRMDDFYTYKNGVLVEQRVDTNYDGKIDLWVWIADGMYITKYARDTNFDGKPDIVKNFGNPNHPKQASSHQ